MPQPSLGFLAPTWLLLAMRGSATRHLNSRQHPLPRPSASTGLRRLEEGVHTGLLGKPVGTRAGGG